jgi:hypothetical protein
LDHRDGIKFQLKLFILQKSLNQLELPKRPVYETYLRHGQCSAQYSRTESTNEAEYWQKTAKLPNIEHIILYYPRSTVLCHNGIVGVNLWDKVSAAFYVIQQLSINPEHYGASNYIRLWSTNADILLLITRLIQQ